ncbi:hypothetical protein [Clostridium sp. YIM B02569]|uniref:hypothetical protein n=1 Tax=Clostridium sp. YIM B02569 TaxID=2911967 RepID=UPI001EEBE971|nr:hypothetical protein [Clostridium sp. YIM B02569]
MGKYIDSKTKILVKHNVCGYTWETSPHSFINGHGCPLCANNLKKDTEWFKKKVFELTGNEYSVLGEYVNNSTKIRIKHNLCGNIFEMKPNAFLDSGQRCPKERYIKSSEGNRQTQGKPDEKNKIIKEICEKEGYKLIKGYVKANVNLILKHCKCGAISKIRPYHFIVTGVRCQCETESRGEMVIREWLEENNIKFKREYKIAECIGKERALSFDFAIFNDNDLVCLVEFDGAQHFTPKFGMDNFKQTKMSDVIKNGYCSKNNINLIRIKYNRSEKYNLFKEKIINELQNKLSNIDMTIPSQAYKETLGRCND